MGSTDTKFTKPTPTDATTTDGFRVGRRVRWEGMDLEGEIIGTSTTREYLWSIRWDDGRKGEHAALHLVLLPEPDAPATPEPAKPSYYAKLREAGCEPFAVIRGCMSRERAVAYHQGTAIAYLIRAEHKHDSPDDDIRKAHAHLAEAVAILDGRTA